MITVRILEEHEKIDERTFILEAPIVSYMFVEEETGLHDVENRIACPQSFRVPEHLTVNGKIAFVKSWYIDKNENADFVLFFFDPGVEARISVVAHRVQEPEGCRWIRSMHTHRNNSSGILVTLDMDSQALLVEDAEERKQDYLQLGKMIYSRLRRAGKRDPGPVSGDDEIRIGRPQNQQQADED